MRTLLQLDLVKGILTSRALPNIIMRAAIFSLFFFGVGSWAHVGAHAIGGPFYRGDCFVGHIKWEESWAKVFNRVASNAEQSILLENHSLKGLQFPSFQQDYLLSISRTIADDPNTPLFPAADEYKSPFWTCRRFILG